MAGATFSEAGNFQINANGLADGIQLQGAVNPYVHDIDIEQPVNGMSATCSPETLRARRVTVHQATAIGFAVGATDSTWTDCLALGCAAQGWFRLRELLAGPDGGICRPADRPVRLGTTCRFPGMLRSPAPDGSR